MKAIFSISSSFNSPYFKWRSIFFLLSFSICRERTNLKYKMKIPELTHSFGLKHFKQLFNAFIACTQCLLLCFYSQFEFLCELWIEILQGFFFHFFLFVNKRRGTLVHCNEKLFINKFVIDLSSWPVHLICKLCNSMPALDRQTFVKFFHFNCYETFEYIAIFQLQIRFWQIFRFFYIFCFFKFRSIVKLKLEVIFGEKKN